MGTGGHRRQSPAHAGPVLRSTRDRLLEADLLPVTWRWRQGKTRLARQRQHRIIGAQRIAKQTPGTERRRTAFKIVEQRRADSLPLHLVIDGQSDFETVVDVIDGIARLADE